MRVAFSIVLILGFVGCNSRPDDVVAKSDRRIPSAIEDFQTTDFVESKIVSLKVTGMMCPHGCYPQVKSLIAKSNNVESIELTPQLKADTIDNPVVLVKYRGEIDRDATTKAIIEAGFEKVEYTEQ